jgi:hypothetical protein
MTAWEEKIIKAFIERYYVGNGEQGYMRIRSDVLFPAFGHAPPDQRESFLEACEALERRGVLECVWEKHRKGEILSSLLCRNIEGLFTAAGKEQPAEILNRAKTAAQDIADSYNKYSGLFKFIYDNLSLSEVLRGINEGSLNEAEQLFKAFSKGVAEGKTTRALSVLLYHDSKRLEALLELFHPLLEKAQKAGIETPPLSLLDRAFPEVWLAGRFILTGTAGNAAGKGEPAAQLSSAAGAIMGMALQTIEKFTHIEALPAAGRTPAKPFALLIENKETFYALAANTGLPLNDRAAPDCCIYVAGHPNRAVAALVRLFAASGFVLYHTGDLDPDGILILQELNGIVSEVVPGLKVMPFRMDAATFDRYVPWGRKLEPTMLKRLSLINQATLALPGIAELAGRIQDTGLGVEQEIIDYRCGLES